MDSLVQLGLGFFNHCFIETKRSKNVTLEFMVYISLTFSCTNPVLGHSKKKSNVFLIILYFFKRSVLYILLNYSQELLITTSQQHYYMLKGTSKKSLQRFYCSNMKRQKGSSLLLLPSVWALSAGLGSTHTQHFSFV